MSDQLDKFVLQYIVEQRDAISRLEQLQNKVKGVGQESNSTAKKVKEFAADATGEIGKIVPGLDKVSEAIRGMSMEFTAAAAASGAVVVGVAAIAAGTKSVIDMREQYNKQRRESMDIGVSSLRLEEYQRKFVKASGGNISREQTAEEIKKLSQFSSSVFRDPTRIGQEARTARILGIDMGQPGEHKSVNDMMTQLGEKFSKMTDAQVQAQAKTLGMNQDFALGLKRQGAGVGNITELSEEEIKNRRVAQTELEKFNEAFARLKDNFTKAENILGEKLLPPFLRFIEAMADLSEKLPKSVNKYAEPAGRAAIQAATLGFGEVLGFIDEEENPITKKQENAKPFDATKTDAAIKQAFSDVPSMDFNVPGATAQEFGKPKPPEYKSPESQKTSKSAEKSAEEASKNAAKTAANLKEIVDGEYDANAEARNIADSQALAINQFAGAVASFANAVDERQAWAAWAGEIGKASGLGGPAKENATPMAPTPSPVTSAAKESKQQATNYDAIFEEAAKKFSVPVELSKSVAKVESRMNPKAVSDVGAVGLMQIMPSNNKGLGITDATDPRQNIMGGTELLADFLKRAGGNIPKALMMYHGGLDTSKWGPKTRAYPEKVLKEVSKVSGLNQKIPTTAPAQTEQKAEGNSPIIGESREKINIRSVQNTIAQRLGIPVAQLQQGLVNRGDVAFANSQITSGLQNHIYDIQNQLRAVNLPQQVRSKMITDLRAQQSGLTMMRQFGPKTEEKAQPGERSITIGERAIIINVNGTSDPGATAEAIKSHLSDHLGELVNGSATGMKY